MKTSQTGIDMIKGFEEFRGLPYLCEGRKLTIGYGHVLRTGENWTHITPQEGEDILSLDLMDTEDTISRLVHVPLTQNQLDALISLVFNIGGGAFASSTLLKQLNNHNYMMAAVEIMRWIFVTVGNEKKPILFARRYAEAKLFLS